MTAARRAQPFAVLDYYKMLRKQGKDLIKHRPWTWLRPYLQDTDKADELRQAFKATVERGPKIKFGVEVPRSVRHALSLDKANGNNLWEEAINKELGQINQYKTFRRVQPQDKLSEYTRIPYHIIFDVKFDLRRKARLVAGGNHTDPPKDDIYSGVVGMETIRLGFVIAAANGYQVCAADIGNAFLYGTTKEKVYINAGPEFGDDSNQPLILHKSLYGLRSSSARFHEHLSAKLRTMGYLPSKADPDFWIKKVGDRYEYIARFVDDVLAFGHNPLATIEELRKDYLLKGVGKPEYYLGGNVEELDPTWNADKVTTALSAKTYLKNVIEKFETRFEGPLRQYTCPMDENYHPEVDETPFCTPDQASLFRALVGSANWAITLGRFDIAYATNTLSRYGMQPRTGHLQAMKRVFGYLKRMSKGRIIVDPHPMDLTRFDPQDFDWTEFYPDAVEEMPPNLPQPSPLQMRVTIWLDADHAHDLVTRRSVTGMLVFVNNTPVRWFSKRQKTVETSTYGSELVAARMAVELAIDLRYQLRMLGVQVNEPTLMLCDNKSVVINTSIPSSQLKKKHNAIAYHRVREAIAANIVRIAHVPSAENVADVLTKPLPGPAYESLVYPWLFRMPATRLQQTNPPPMPVAASKGSQTSSTPRPDEGTTPVMPSSAPHPS